MIMVFTLKHNFGQSKKLKKIEFLDVIKDVD